MSSVQKYFDVDSTYRNRNNYPNPYDFVIPYSFPNKGSTTSSFFDPILESSPFTGSPTLQPGQLLTQVSADTSHITLDAADSIIDNFYINITLQIATEFRTILSYDGTTKVATVDAPFSSLPAPGTQYFTRRTAGYFNSDVAIYSYDPVTNTVSQLNLLTNSPSPVRDFYSGSYIRFTNGPHVSTTALITAYDPTGSLLAWAQLSSFGSNAFISTTTEQGFLFTPNTSGTITSITINLTSLETVSPNRSFLLRVRQGTGLGGSILYSNTFTVSNTSTPTDTTFNLTSGPSVNATQFYVLTVIDTTANGIDTGYLNFYGISPSNTWVTYGELNVYPKVSMSVIPSGTPVWSQLNTSLLPLDNISTTARAAYSLRKLRSSYSGSAIRVRRSSDNAEQDIGFTTGNQLDVLALKTFIGSNSGFIRTWYDQSGNGNNSTQTTTSNQPRIVNSGVIDNLSGVPVLNFNGVNSYLSLTSYPFTGLSNCSINLVCQVTTVATSARYFDLGSSSTVTFFTAPSNGSNILTTINDGAGVQSVTGTITDTSNHVTTVIHSGSAITIYRDRTSVGTGAISKLPSSVSGSNNYIGKSQNGADPYLTGNFQEIIFFQASLSSNDQSAIEYDQKSYYSTV